MFIPFMNRKGAIAGFFAPAVPIGLQIASMSIDTTCNPKSRMMVEHSYMNLTNHGQEVDESPYWQQLLFCMSPFMFGLIGLTLFFVISVPVSWATCTKEEILHKNSPLMVYHK